MKFVSNTLKYVGVFFLGMGLMSPSVWGQKLFNPGEKIDKTIHKTMGWPSQAQQNKNQSAEEPQQQAQEQQPAVHETYGCFDSYLGGVGFVRVARDTRNPIVIRNSYSDNISGQHPMIVFMTQRCHYEIRFDTMAEAIVAAEMMLKDYMVEVTLWHTERLYRCTASQVEGNLPTCGSYLEGFLLRAPLQPESQPQS